MQLQEELLTEEYEDRDEDSEPEEDIALEKQLAWAEHRIKELEALIAAAVSTPLHHHFKHATAQLVLGDLFALLCHT